LTTGFISGSITVYAKASTPIQYSLAYASSGATAMQYELRVVVAGTTAPSSTGTVSSFNGRTGAVTPASGDYTAAQVGALATTQYVAGKNFIINGGMDIWQRGTSFTGVAVNAYTADRWQTGTWNSSGNVTQDSTLIPPNARYGLRVTSTSSALAWSMQQLIETANVLPYAGQNVTVSFNIAASFTGGDFYPFVYYNTTADASIGTAGWLPCTRVAFNDAIPLATNTFVNGNGVFSVPSNAKSVYVIIQQYGATLSSGQYITLGNVQLEWGNTQTQFSRAGGSIGGELALCQRYFYKVYSSAATSINEKIAIGQATSGTTAIYQIPLPITMRIAPSGTISSLGASSVAIINSANTTAYGCTSIGYDSATPNNVSLTASLGSSLLSVGNASTLLGNANGWYLGFSAEL